MSALGLVYVVVIGSAIWVGVDASQRDFSRDGFANKTWKWVVGCLLLWIIVFPVYLARRSRAPLRRAPASASVATAGSGILPPHMQSARGYELPTAAAPPSPAAGWYVDPQDERQLRYWDGERWSSSTAPPRDAPSQSNR